MNGITADFKPTNCRTKSIEVFNVDLISGDGIRLNITAVKLSIGNSYRCPSITFVVDVAVPRKI